MLGGIGSMEPELRKEDTKDEPTKDEPKRKWNADKAQVIVAYLTFVALLVVIYQTFLSQRQYKLQEETTNRAWAAEHLAAIYSDPPLPRHVRQEAVRAYLRLQQVANSEVRLPSADLRDMNLEEEVFTRADLTDAKMERCVLNRADLKEARLHRAELLGAELNSAHLEDAKLIRTNLSNAKLQGSFLNGADLRGARFSQFVEHDLATNFKDYILGAVVRGANFEDALFDSSTVFCEVDAEGAKLHKVIGFDEEHVEFCTFKVSDSTTLPPSLIVVENSARPVGWTKDR